MIIEVFEYYIANYMKLYPNYIDILLITRIRSFRLSTYIVIILHYDTI